MNLLVQFSYELVIRSSLPFGILTRAWRGEQLEMALQADDLTREALKRTTLAPAPHLTLQPPASGGGGRFHRRAARGRRARGRPRQPPPRTRQAPSPPASGPMTRPSPPCVGTASRSCGLPWVASPRKSPGGSCSERAEDGGEGRRNVYTRLPRLLIAIQIFSQTLDRD